MHFKIISRVLCGCFDIGKRVEKFTHSSRAPSYFAVLVQNTLWSRYDEQYLCTVSKQSQRMMFQDYNIQQFLEKQPGITHLPNIFFDCVSLLRSKTCPEQTSLYRPCLHLLSCHIRAFRVFSFAVFQLAFYDPSSLPQFSHIQCLPRSLQKSYSTYFEV